MQFPGFPTHERGYTRDPAIRAILDRHEVLGGSDPEEGQIVHFDGLTFDDAIRLMEHLPAWHLKQRQNESPTIREMIQLGFRFAGITFHGYRVPPDRDDERISFEGFQIPKSETNPSEIEQLYRQLSPDLLLDQMDDGDTWNFWWD